MIKSERKYKSAQRSRETDCLILCFPLLSVLCVVSVVITTTVPSIHDTNLNSREI